MVKKIAITGAHGAGKTTLAKALSETLGLPLITERARTVAGYMGIGHCRELAQNRALAWRFQEEVLETQIRAQSEYPGGFVSDRSTLDCIAYFRFYLGDRFRGAEASRYYYRARFHAWRKLDLLVYVPPISCIEPDGFRLEDGAEQIDAIIAAEALLAEKNGLRVLRLERKSVEDRVSEVLACLQGRGDSREPEFRAQAEKTRGEEHYQRKHEKKRNGTSEKVASLR